MAEDRITGDRDAAGRLVALRARLSVLGVDGFLLPRADEHQSEYLPPSAERLAWLTGFTGSAGSVVVLPERAAVFTDGRYTLQIRAEVDAALYETINIADRTPADWIGEHLGPGRTLGVDPWLHTVEQLERVRRSAEKSGGKVVLLDENPVDGLWTGRPAAPVTPMIPHEDRFAGRPATEKRAEIAAEIAKAGEDALLLTSAESIAWLLNVRGSDVPRTPLSLCFALLGADGSVDLFVDPAKIGTETRAHLGNAVRIRVRDELGEALDALARTGGKIRVDPTSSPAWVAERIRKTGGKPVEAPDPIVLAKAQKNPIELEGARRAHLRDALAYARFLHWFDREAPTGRLDEIAAAERLRQLRAEHGMFRDLSFETISGAGPNGAIVHYRVTPATNRRIVPGELYLIDSGAQYPDGTTDITRTLWTGPAKADESRCFTLVLKGMIALSRAVFPEGTTGSQLDAVARLALWSAGLDYDHGTGHGVGSYLGVHEGPQRISKAANPVALKPGMIISNEPGYYRAGAFGIRIENLIVVEPRVVENAERRMLGFETLTLAPIDRRLIDARLLDPGERSWLDAYHGRVRESLTPHLETDVGHWLAAATAPL